MDRSTQEPGSDRIRLLVTGAGGFLGRHVVDAAVRAGFRVRAIVRPAGRVPAGWPAGVEVFRADLRGGVDLTPAFDRVDALIHLAAAVSGGEDIQFASGVVGTERLLEAMARSSASRLVLASSFSVYDWSRIRGRVDEESPLESDLYERDGYAVAKVWQERVVRREAQRKGWSLCVLRPGWIWGRGNEYLAGIGQSCGPVHFLFGGSRELALTHVENCADCFVTCATDDRAFGQTFNVVDDHSVSNRRYLGAYLRAHRVRQWRFPIPYSLCFAGVRGVSALSKVIFKGKGKLPSVFVPCRFEARFNPVKAGAGRLRDVLGWRPPLTFEQALERTYSNQPGRGFPVEPSQRIGAA